MRLLSFVYLYASSTSLVYLHTNEPQATKCARPTSLQTIYNIKNSQRFVFFCILSVSSRGLTPGFNILSSRYQTTAIKLKGLSNRDRWTAHDYNM